MLKYKGLVSFCENVGTDESCYQQRMQPPPAASKPTFHSENLLWPAAADTRDTSPLRLFRHCNCSSSFVTVVVFFSFHDGNLSKLWAVCVLCRLRAADPRTKHDHFWGIKFPNILPTPRLTSLNVLDTIFIISNIDLNKNWTREMISCWCFPTASPFLIHAGSGSRQQARVKFWLIGVIINSQEMLGATSRNWAQSSL